MAKIQGLKVRGGSLPSKSWGSHESIYPGDFPNAFFCIGFGTASRPNIKDFEATNWSNIRDVDQGLTLKNV